MSIYGDNNILLAPLAGITDIYMRQLAIEQGAGFTFTEMISAKGMLYDNARTHRLLRLAPSERHVGVQIFGRDPQIMYDTVQLIDDIYKDDAALFDVNMGCPVPKVIGNGEGSALMKEPRLAAEIIAAMKKATKKPVTAKMRIGFDENNAVEFAKALEGAGVDAITVHGRLRSQYYSGKADWDTIAEVKRNVGIHVNANGDIFSAEDAKAILERTGADGIMVARGVLGNPFIFRYINDFFATGEYKEASIEERMELAKRHAHMVVEGEGERLGIKALRKHGAWYLKGVRGGAAARDRIVRSETLEEFCAVLDDVIRA